MAESLPRKSPRRFRGRLQNRVPSLDHLLTLKLHVLKQNLPHRFAKDAEDLEMLVRRNGLDLHAPHYEELFRKYGTEGIYDTFVRILRNP